MKIHLIYHTNIVIDQMLKKAKEFEHEAAEAKSKLESSLYLFCCVFLIENFGDYSFFLFNVVLFWPCSIMSNRLYYG